MSRSPDYVKIHFTSKKKLNIELNRRVLCCFGLHRDRFIDYKVIEKDFIEHTEENIIILERVGMSEKEKETNKKNPHPVD